ncbi:hypothetical protein [Flindersiella endophytica]
MLEMLIGAAIFAAGMAAGRFLPSRRGGRGKQKEIQPICACGHAVSFHGEDGRCRAEAEVTEWKEGRWMGNTRQPCTCQKYTGPQPLPTFYAPEITE